MNKYIYILIIIFSKISIANSQTFYVYGSLNEKDKKSLHSILLNLINENKNKPLKNVMINSINNNDNKLTKFYKSINALEINAVVDEIFYLLKSDKPKENLFKINLSKFNNNKDILIYDLNNIPNNISLKSKNYKYSNSSIGLNYFKQPINFDYLNINSKYEITVPYKTIKLRYNSDAVKIDKIVYKTEKYNWKEISDFYAEEDYLVFQIQKYNSKPFDLSILLISEEGDSSKIKTINNIKFSKTDQNYLAEITGITLETPSLTRCKILSESSGSNHYYIKILTDKDFDIDQLNLNLRIIDTDNIKMDHIVQLRDVEPEYISILNINDKRLYCFFIGPKAWFGDRGECYCDNYGENAKLELLIENNIDYTSYFKPNNISNKILPVQCQGFRNTREELKILPLCDCK
jgi:hypothetical protein